MAQQHAHHNPTNMGMVSTPHGPETGDDHASFRGSDFDPNASDDALTPHLFPDDMYTKDKVYYGDLSFGEQVKFITKVDKAEAKKEFGAFWKMFKADPLSPVGWYFKNAVLPGAGLGLEGCVST